MSFLNKFTKGVSKAAEQAKFEADKMMRVNRVGSELSQLSTEAEKATAAIGAKVMELRAAGTLQVPELDELVQRVDTLKAQVAAKQAELDNVRAEKFEAAPAAPVAPPPEAAYAPPPAPPATEAVPAPEAMPAPEAAAPAPEVVAAPEAAAPAPEAPAAPEAAPAPKFCPSCGAATEPGTKFCPSCGQKLG
jgi:hypothetical protein